MKKKHQVLNHSTALILHRILAFTHILIQMRYKSCTKWMGHMITDWDIMVVFVRSLFLSFSRSVACRLLFHSLFRVCWRIVAINSNYSLYILSTKHITFSVLSVCVSDAAVCICVEYIDCECIYCKAFRLHSQTHRLVHLELDNEIHICNSRESPASANVCVSVFV